MILALCEEIERLRPIADERTAQYSDYTLLGFGQHGDKKLADVPEDYLRWWFKANADRSVLHVETQFGPYGQRATARKKLLLHDYLRVRFNVEKD